MVGRRVAGRDGERVSASLWSGGSTEQKHKKETGNWQLSGECDLQRSPSRMFQDTMSSSWLMSVAHFSLLLHSPTSLSNNQACIRVKRQPTLGGVLLILGNALKASSKQNSLSWKCKVAIAFSWSHPHGRLSWKCGQAFSLVDYKFQNTLSGIRISNCIPATVRLREQISLKKYQPFEKKF